MRNNTLYILCGLPYSGKTTLTNELVERFGFGVVSVDKIMDRREMWRPGHPTQEDWDIAYSEGYQQLKDLLGQNKSVVLDIGHLRKHERDTARKIAEEFGVAHKLIYVSTPREEILKRREQNKEIKVRGHVPEDLFEKGLEMFEEPTSEENPIFYNPEMNLNEWIRKNIESDVSVQPEVK